jgi:signal transduction histidine kinase
VYGERATPYEVLSDFADRMGGAYDATELLPLMARTVGQGVDAVWSQVWLRRDGEFELAAIWAIPGETPSSLLRARRSLDSIEGDRITEVRDRGEVLGAVAVLKPAGKELTPVEERLLQTLAAQAGPVLRNVRLIEDLRSSRQRLVATQDDERRRLERNLHDGAQQSLVAVALMLRLVQPKVATQDQQAGASLEQAAAELGHAIEDLRDLARGIYPAVLAERGLGAALSSLAERSPVPAVVDDQTSGRVSADVERALYFITAEALASSALAHATEVTVRVGRAAGALTLSIVDDGLPANDPVRGLAQQRLLDRAAVVDAALTVDGIDASGLRLVCTVPVADLPADVRGEDTDVSTVPMGAGQ